MKDILLSIGLILGLILFGGIFVAGEISLISLRESQVKNLAQQGKRGERIKTLAASPNRFLAAAQIGVTFAGFMSAAFGEARLSSHLAPEIERALDVSSGVADVLSLIAITLVISYVAIVVGELVPKRLGLQRAEGAALLLAPFLARFATIMRPVGWVLSRSTRFHLRVLCR